MVTNFLQNIRKLWQHDKTSAEQMTGRGHAVDAESMPHNGVGLFNGINSINSLQRQLSVGQKLLERYADYENMDDYPELGSAIDIYADDATIPDSVRGKTMWAESKDKLIRDIIDDCLYRRLRIEEDIWLLVRTLGKYGNVFAEIIVSDSGVTALKYLPVPTMRCVIDGKGNVLGYVQDLSGHFEISGLVADASQKVSIKKTIEDSGLVFFEPWEIVHWRLRSKYVHSVYGYSIIDNARWVWKRLAMFEDTALVYKLTRSPGRYAFYVDTGDLPPQEAMALVRKVKRDYKKRTLVNPNSGELEFKRNPLQPEDDIFIPTRGGKESTRVDVLSGPDWQNMEDIEYFKNKMYTAIKIPRGYFGGDAEADQATAQRDVRFARTVMRLQREFKNGMRKVMRIHLASIGIDPDTIEWQLKMTVPSSIFELQQIEVMSAQAGLMETLGNWFDSGWLLQHVLHFSADDASKVVQANEADKERQLENAARVDANIKRKYPMADVGASDMMGQPMGQPQPALAGGAPIEHIDHKRKSENSAKQLLETIKETKRVARLTDKRLHGFENKLDKILNSALKIERKDRRKG